MRVASALWDASQKAKWARVVAALPLPIFLGAATVEYRCQLLSSLLCLRFAANWGDSLSG